MQRKCILLLAPVLLFLLLSNCATIKSDMAGKFEGEYKKTDKEKVNVLFVFRHIKQAKGIDAIPKLQRENQIIRDFDNLFYNSFGELTNVDKYAAYTEFPSDVSKPERREKLAELIDSHDFVIRINISRTHSFIKHFIGTIFSSISLTLAPIPYKTSYSIQAEVFDKTGNIVKKYERSASMKSWVQTFLVFAQPFHYELIKKERIYLEFLHDIFKQIES